MSHFPCCQCDEDYSADDLAECRACGELVCYDCTKQSSGPHECIDYTICRSCHEGRESDRAAESSREWAARRDRSAAAKARYNTPEARAKRAAKKAETARVRTEQEVERRQRTAKSLAAVMAEFARFF